MYATIKTQYEVKKLQFKKSLVYFKIKVNLILF